jgi:hypothetical protein
MTSQTVIDDETIVVVEQPQVQTVVVEQPSISVVSAGIQGPPGPPGMDAAGSQIKFEFHFGDVAEQIIGSIPAGQLLYTRIDIMTAFDASGIDATIGTTSTPNSILAAGFIDLARVGTYELYTNTELGSATQYKLFFTAGTGGTQGRGVLRIYFDT